MVGARGPANHRGNAQGAMGRKRHSGQGGGAGHRLTENPADCRGMRSKHGSRARGDVSVTGDLNCNKARGRMGG